MRPYMRAANVTWRGIDVSDVNQMDFTEAEQRTYELRRGDILLAEASGSASEVGKPAIWRDEVPGACFQNTLVRVRCADPRVVPFLYWHFMGDALNGRFAESSRGTGIHHLGAKQMENWPTVLPPAGEQARIVAAIETHFSRLDAAVASLTRAKANLKRARASVLKAAVEGRLVPTEAALARAEGRDYEPASALLARILAERKAAWAASGAQRKYTEPVKPETEALPGLPEGWCWVSADQLAWSSGYGTSVKCSAEASGPPVLRIPNVQRGSIDLDDLKFATDPAALKPDGALEPGDLIFVRTNGSLRLIGLGAAVLAPLSVPTWFASYLIRLRLCGGPTVWRWTTLVWNGPVVRQYVQRDAASSAGQFNVSMSAATQYALPLPPLAEQQRIVAEVDRRLSVLDALDATLEANLARCARLRQSVLKIAFEGRLVPTEAPAEATPLAAEPNAASYGTLA